MYLPWPFRRVKQGQPGCDSPVTLLLLSVIYIATSVVIQSENLEKLSEAIFSSAPAEVMVLNSDLY